MAEILAADQAGIDRAIGHLARGDLVALPTETVYGLAGDALNPAAVQAIFAAKGRPNTNPLIIHVSDLAAAEKLGVFDDVSRRLARAFWPGPLTLVVPLAPDCPVVPMATPGGKTIALRVPDHRIFRQVLMGLGRPLAAPSANPSGAVSPTRAAHVVDGLGQKIAAVIDGGPALVGVESTVVQVSDGMARILRPGGLTRAMIDAVIGSATTAAAPARVSADTIASAPGQLASHYAPRARVRLNAVECAQGEALLAFGAQVPATSGPMANLSPAGDLAEAAANLFHLLRLLDQSGAQTIAVMPIPNEGLGEAINDRLTRAAAHR
jgi:L-threonylcarbamoyladenylate synthase